MPPSPAIRCSPGRELRGDNQKRGRSLDGRIFYREKDDDLALFNEMENREKDNFLLQSNDDFDDILSSKFKDFSSNKLGVAIPTRGESSDLLNADADKNDYDWLLTPPETPLFRSLDDEAPVVTPAQRGRPRTKPVTISRSSTMDKNYTSSRGSASPNRLSLSPRSSNSTIHSIRPSSASGPRSSPSRGTTPPRGPSPPPRKPSTPVLRSSTPTSRRATPINNKSRGNSISPKSKPWQINIPGFPSDAPPNLRTSLRGSSPVSRNGRQSMSPVASRSASSSHSKGSIASSGDDDADSLLSVPINLLENSGQRRGVAYGNNHSPSLSRKVTRPGLSSSAPKRSFESALRQMDHHRKTPQNMFRPLLSSVPSSTFHAGKSTSTYRSLISRNSSVTSSSNTSSDPTPANTNDAEGIDQNQYTAASTYGKSPYIDSEDDIFILEKTDSIGEAFSPVATNGGAGNNFQNIEHLSSPMVTTETPEILDVKSKFLEVKSSHENRSICSECGLFYLPIEITEEESNLCPDCKRTLPAVIVPEVSQNLSINNLNDYKLVDSVEPSISVTESSGPTDVSVTSVPKCDENVDEVNIPYLSSHNSSEKILNMDQVVDELTTVNNISSEGDKMVQNIPNLKLDVSEGTGISILLKRSNSAKGPFIQSRSFTATSISFDDLSYVRDYPTSMRSSTSSLDINTKHRRSGSSLSGTSGHNLHGISLNNNEIIVVNDENEAVITNAPPEEQSLGSECAIFDGENEIICHDVVETVPANIQNINSFSNIDELREDFQTNTQRICEGEEDLVVSDGDVADIVEIPTHSLLETISEIEIENGHPGSPDSHSYVGSSDSSIILDELLEPSASTTSDKDITAALIAECDNSDHARGKIEESTVTIELGSKSKSLTLEEATDAILFCSSIVHNLAYEAANIAIEKENSAPLEALRPSITILGNSNSENTKQLRGRTVTKRTPKSQKTRKRHMETDTDSKMKNYSGENGDDIYEKSSTRIVGVPDRGDSMNPPKLESKCNCTIM